MKTLKKADIVLGIVIITIGLVMSIGLSIVQPSKGNIAAVYVNSKLYGTYSLNSDREITISRNYHKNKVTIKEGKISMTFSDCKNQDCIKMGGTDSPARRIICLPNRILIEVKGSDGKNIDAISN